MPELPWNRLASPLQSLERVVAGSVPEVVSYGLVLLLFGIVSGLSAISPLTITMMEIVLALTLFPATSIGLGVLRDQRSRSFFSFALADVAALITFLFFLWTEGLSIRVALLLWFAIVVYSIPFFLVQLGNDNLIRLGVTVRDYGIVLIAIVLTTPLIQPTVEITSWPLPMDFMPMLFLGAVFIPAVIFGAIRCKPFQEIGFTLRFSLADLLLSVVGGAVLFAILVAVGLRLGDRLTLTVGATELLASVVFNTLLVALAQEFVFRGLLFSFLRQSLSRWPFALGTVLALIVSSGAFALAYALTMPNVYLVGTRFVMGLVLGLIFLRSGRLGVPILASGVALGIAALVLVA